MNRTIKATSGIWLFLMAVAGTGCTFIGPFLPSLANFWHLHDRRAGLLISFLFIGSFSGTMLLAKDLRRTWRLGGISAALGLALFAAATRHTNGAAVGAGSLIVLGFGLGQLMSSVNLVVGTAPVQIRARALANLGSAWCAGAVLSPLLTTVLFTRWTPELRLVSFALLYLLPLAVAQEAAHTSDGQQTGEHLKTLSASRISRSAFLWITIFLVYGGVEASIAGWMPMFAVRYSIHGMGLAQWVVSIFWCGLIAGRVLMGLIVRPSMEGRVLRAAVVASGCCLLCMMLATSANALLLGILLTGICIGPVFPLLLSSVLDRRFGNRIMGFVLAACGIGGVLFPAALGDISAATSLRIAMALPLISLLTLLVVRGPATQAAAEPAMIIY